MNKRCAIGNTAVMPSPERGLTPSIKRSEDELLPIATGSVAGGFHGQVAAIASKTGHECSSHGQLKQIFHFEE